MQAASGRQEFPEKRKAMFCYKAPSDSLLIQVRLCAAAVAADTPMLLHCVAGRLPFGQPCITVSNH